MKPEIPTMMNQATFLDMLRFASSAAALKDIRYYLNGVLIELRAASLTMVGTDGSRIAVIESVVGLPAVNEADIIVSAADIKMLLGAVKREDLPGLQIDSNEGTLHLKDRSGRDWPLKGIEGKYPDWRRITPISEKVPTATIGLSADALSDVGKACAKLQGKKFSGVQLDLRGPSTIATFSPIGHGYAEAYISLSPYKL